MFEYSMQLATAGLKKKLEAEATQLMKRSLDQLLSHCKVSLSCISRAQQKLFVTGIQPCVLKTQPLLEYLLLSVNASCSDPRDKVYGILGLCDDEVRRAVPIDYNATLDEVLTTITAYLIQSLKTMAISCQKIFLCTKSHQDGVSSWVPYVSRSRRTLSIRDIISSTVSTTYSASRGRDFHPRFSQDLRTLTVEGVKIGRISKVTERLDGPDQISIRSWMSFSNLPDKADEVYPFRCRSLPTGCKKKDRKRCRGQPGAQVSWSEAFWRTILSDRVRGHRLGCLLNDLDGTEAYSPFDHIRFPPRNEIEYSSLLTSLGHSDPVFRCRRLFMTDDDFIGLGPEDTHKGDIVVLPIGEQVPYLMREFPDGGEFQLVGQCYLHGAMDGEIIEDLEAGRYQTQTFDLR
jgi:hypothetical protein